jgi:hypothetical protein
VFLLLASHAHAHSGPAVPPPNRLTDWASPLVVEDTGSRLMMIVEASDTVPVRIEARVGESWVGLEELWHEGSLSVFRLDLASTDAVSLRSSDQERIVALDWDLFEPGTPEPRLEGVAPPSPGVLPAELVDIGVISRSDWGAQSTTCTSTENDWYRMAVHHTAGSQTSGGSVQGAVKSLQSYALGTGTYCDIPYQFLVGYDGSLWEGRPYDYYSGATGGGNNDGNSAVSFLGCYHPEPGCGTAHAATDAMMDAGQLLIQTFSALHGIETTDEYIRGHQDWPGNSTACPGDYILARFDELLEPLLRGDDARGGPDHHLLGGPEERGREELEHGQHPAGAPASRRGLAPGQRHLAVLQPHHRAGRRDRCGLDGDLLLRAPGRDGRRLRALADLARGVGHVVRRRRRPGRGQHGPRRPRRAGGDPGLRGQRGGHGRLGSSDRGLRAAAGTS